MGCTTARPTRSGLGAWKVWWCVSQVLLGDVSRSDRAWKRTLQIIWLLKSSDVQRIAKASLTDKLLCYLSAKGFKLRSSLANSSKLWKGLTLVARFLSCKINYWKILATRTRLPRRMHLFWKKWNSFLDPPGFSTQFSKMPCCLAWLWSKENRCSNSTSTWSQFLKASFGTWYLDNCWVSRKSQEFWSQIAVC